MVITKINVDYSPLFYSQHTIQFSVMDNEEISELELLGKRLRKYRLCKNYSQEKLAELSNLDRTYISSLERGKRNPSYLIIKRISKILDITPNQLFED